MISPKSLLKLRFKTKFDFLAINAAPGQYYGSIEVLKGMISVIQNIKKE